MKKFSLLIVVILLSLFLGISTTSNASTKLEPIKQVGISDNHSSACSVGLTESLTNVVKEIQTDRPVQVNIQVHLENEPDLVLGEQIITFIDATNPIWKVTVFVSPNFAENNPEAVRSFESRGHEIAVLGTLKDAVLKESNYQDQLDLISDAFDAVRNIVNVPEKVEDWKPQIFDWNNDTIGVLRNLGIRSISDLFACNEAINCMCPYAQSLGKVTFPYPVQTDFWAIPVSDVEAASGTIALDDGIVYSTESSSTIYYDLLVKKYSEQQLTKDPLIIAVHGSTVAEDLSRLQALESFISYVSQTGGKLVTLDNFINQSYITNFDVVSPSGPIAPGNSALTINYTSTLYCPKFRFRAYGKYAGGESKLIGSSCQYVSTGDHSLEMAITIPKPSSNQTIFYITVVGQSSAGSCSPDDPEWPNLQSFEVKKDLQITIQPRCIQLPNRSNGSTEDRIDVVFVPDADYGTAANINTWLPVFLSEVNAQIDQRLFGKDPLTGNNNKFNFYYTRDQGDASDTACGPSATLPTDLLTDCSFADTVVVTHKTEFGDCSSVNQSPDIYSAEGPMGRSFIHESGHGIFGLADEYDGQTAYFQPDPMPNIWATETGCQSDAENSGWTKTDCQMFTSRQNDWWKLGSAQFIMKDGSHFNNGWGAPSSRRITWYLGQFPPAASETSVIQSVPLSKNTINLDLNFDGNVFTYVDAVNREKDTPPNIVTSGYGYYARTYDSGGNLLGEVGFNDPRTIHAEEGYEGPEILPSINFTLNLPYYYNGDYIKFFSSTGIEIANTLSIGSVSSAKVTGLIADRNGYPVPNTQLEFIGSEQTNTLSMPNGAYVLEGLEAGTYVINVIPPPERNLSPRTLTTTVSKGVISVQDITLDPGATVQGVVRTFDGDPIQGEVLYVSGYETPRFSTNQTGAYAIQGLSSGQYTLNINSIYKYYFYVNKVLTGVGKSLEITTVAGEGLTIDLVRTNVIFMPLVQKANLLGTIVADGDDTYEYVPLPFGFKFYGTTYQGLYVSSNGFITFGSGSSRYSNQCIPNTSTPNNAIYAFWDDLIANGGSNGNVYVRQPSSNTFVIEWHQVKKYGTSTPITFMIILKNDNSITLKYVSVANTSSATVGVENSNGTQAQQYVCNGIGGPIYNGTTMYYWTP